MKRKKGRPVNSRKEGALDGSEAQLVAIYLVYDCIFRTFDLCVTFNLFVYIFNF